MPFLKTKCPKCGKDAEVLKQFEIGSKIAQSLKCGHILTIDQVGSETGTKPEDVVSLDGRKLFPFQCSGVRFAAKSGGRVLIADEMGLGKTVQATALLALYPDMLPAAYVVKSSLKIQWAHEITRWISKSDADEDFVVPLIIEKSTDKMLPGLDHYVFSFDILRRFKNGSLSEQFEKCGIRTLVIDECQQIKNTASSRTKEVRELAKICKNVIALSGTPIKNNAAEYFSILNILHPEIFPTLSKFQYNECQSYWNGYGYKTGGLKDPKAFQEKTKSFIIRRERKEVLPELPTVDRRFQFNALGDEVEEAYRETFKQFQNDYYSAGSKVGSFEESGNILAYLSRMRHLAGLSKISPAVDFVEEFLCSTDRKLTIFVHHKDVSDILTHKLSELVKVLAKDSDVVTNQPLQLTADLNALQRDNLVSQFMNDENQRLLIASTLASGEGLNLQKCSDCVLLERQWNPANEEQAEARFIRIGQQAQSVTATYFVAVGTVDEFFSKLVEQKREIFAKTMSKDGDSIKWDQSSLIKELAEILASQGGRQWGY